MLTFVSISVNNPPNRKIQVDKDGWLDYQYSSPYGLDHNSDILIDAPGAALYQENLAYSVNLNAKDDSPIRLLPEYFLRGRVLNEKGQPIAGAHVKLKNMVSDDMSTPALIISADAFGPPGTISKSDGSWTLRGIAPKMTRYDGEKPQVFAATFVKGRLWTGGAEVEMMNPAKEVPANPFSQNTSSTTPSLQLNNTSSSTPSLVIANATDIILRPTITVRGRVLDDRQNPIADAWVDIYRRTDIFDPKQIKSPLPNGVFSDANGRFKLEGIPLHEMTDPRAFNITAIKPSLGTAVSWLGVREKVDPIRAWEKSGDIILQFADIVRISGKVVDADTGQPVDAFVGISAWRGNYLPHGLMRADQQLGINDSAYLRFNRAQGRFTLPVPSGSNTFTLSYRPEDFAKSNNFYETRIALQLPRGDQSNIVIRVRKNPSFRFAFDLKKEFSKKTILLQLQREGKLLTTLSTREPMFYQAKKWGDDLEYRVISRSWDSSGLSSDTVLVPWKRAIADPKNWILKLKIPDSPSQ